MAGKISKILVGCIFAFSLVFLSSVAMAASQSAKIVGTNVNIREAPNTSAGIVKKLSNTRVSIIDRSSDWYKISFNGKTGWVYSDYIKVLSTEGKINANGVNFRKAASTSSEIIDTLSDGTGVEIIETLSDWYKVKVDSKTGYVSSQFITVTGSSKTSRSTQGAAIDEADDSDDSTAGKIVAYAKKFVGVKYVYGGKSPKGFDCSGYVGYVYKNFGIDLNDSAASMYSNGVKVSKGELQVGDLLFFDASSRKASGDIDHVGIYLGGDRFIHASTSNKHVLIQSLSGYQGTYIGAKRVI